MLHTLKKVHREKKKRLGRGNGSHGTYSGRGVKGQKARSGGNIRPGFEGGRTPLARILPKRRGLGQPAQTYHTPVNLKNLTSYKDGEIVSLSSLKAKGIVPKKTRSVKILAYGEIKKALKIAVPAENVSKEAKSKIEAAKGIILGEKKAEKKESPKKDTAKSPKK